jgi:hypothetical protein
MLSSLSVPGAHLDEEADIAETSMDTIEVAETLLILRL